MERNDVEEERIDEEDGKSDGSCSSRDGEETMIRKSARNRKRKKIFTYNEVGGNPSKV